MMAFTVMIAKAAAGLSRRLGRGGGQALPGLVAERLDPHLARKLVRGLPKGVVLVTGTNGKTTVTKLIVSALEAQGERVVTNSTGSNLKRGVTSALVAAANWRGRLRVTMGVFEVDEASLRLVAPELQPDHIVVLNLFRDQLDRYGELDSLAGVMGQAIATTRARLYLNADDPLVASLAKYAAQPDRVSYFGLEEGPAAARSAHATATDSDRCPVCRERLKFERVFYGHIGHYHCPNGDFDRPRPDVALAQMERSDLSGSKFVVEVAGSRLSVSFPLPGTYNLYNAVAALSVARGLDLELGRAVKGLAATEAAFGRVEQVVVRGRKLYVLLIKNPAGFTQVLETFLLGRGHQPVLLAVNDLAADGRDVSWLWDVPLEMLAPDRPQLLTTGIRGADMALRLKYAGLEARLVGDFNQAIDELLAATSEGETAYILPTYTAMLAIRKRLGQLVPLAEVA